METFQNSDFIELLYDFLDKNRIIYGGSTGAIILGKYISALEEPCAANYNDDKGLKLLGNYSIFCHYKEVPVEKIEKLKNFLLVKKAPIIALTEKSGLIVEGGMAKVVGFEGAYLLEHNNIESPKYIQPGEYFLIK
jgi:dipeptidase E